MFPIQVSSTVPHTQFVLVTVICDSPSNAPFFGWGNSRKPPYERKFVYLTNSFIYWREIIDEC